MDISRVNAPPAPITNPEGIKLHYSKFHVIWSSNLRVYDKSEGLILADQMSDIFVEVSQNKPQDFIKFRVGNSKTYLVQPSEWNNQIIKKYKVRYVIEQGTHPKGGRIHLHAILYLEHFTFLQIEARALQEFLCRRLEQENEAVKGCYLHITWVPSDMPLENYIGKSPFGVGSGIEGL